MFIIEVDAYVFIDILQLHNLFTKVGKNPSLCGLEIGVQCIKYSVDWISVNKIYNYSTVWRIVILLLPF